ncbi:hypothetical protein AA0113_g10326 [Alternaria arborescens]|uniref:Uncharacterized protein n=1 Tax=Alternaria arborescens TaxID=156630 RepID=A0A4V1X0J3_9PLEO|nr:hypothetical protein AA0111_g9760 [Alternaria arborescens]RYN18617.1 hypothetical protein AA0112_g11518 [Alternaria arborescens]RYO21265.1 hypothetical protein AA0111_g9760 [Alternaria arborescens]RYO45688.1 hypothetical protein AA0113_g10326 [Alternaria arborescens]
MRFPTVILPALTGLAFAADSSTNVSQPMSSVAASLSSAASSKGGGNHVENHFSCYSQHHG